MPIVKVTLDTTTGKILLSTNPIDIPPNANPQLIHWHLAGDAYSGHFKSLSGSQPGFEWDGPKPTPFDDPTLSPQKKALTIKDTHTNASSYGEWLYTLRIVVDGTTYVAKKKSITSAKASGGMTVLGGDPTIRNN